MAKHDFEVHGAERHPPATKSEGETAPIEWPAGCPPDDQTPEELRELQKRQNLHAVEMQVEQLTRTMPEIAGMIADLKADNARLRKKCGEHEEREESEHEPHKKKAR